MATEATAVVFGDLADVVEIKIDSSKHKYMQQPTNSNYVNNDIFKMLTKTFFVNPAAIHKTTQFVNHLKFSYLELTELVVMLEHKYNVTFADDEISQLKRVGDLDRLLVVTQKQQ